MKCSKDNAIGSTSNRGLGRLLEVQVVDAADSCTYNAHDVDDAIKLGLVDLEEFESVPLASGALKRIRKRWSNLEPRNIRQELVRELIDVQVSSTLESAAQFLKSANWDSHGAAFSSNFLVGPTGEVADEKIGLQEFLYERIYRHDQLMAQRKAAQQRLRDMVEFLRKQNPEVAATFSFVNACRATRGRPRRSAGDYIWRA